jgi:hypothetical protein
MNPYNFLHHLFEGLNFFLTQLFTNHGLP